MSDRREGSNKRPEGALDEWVKSNKHLKWPLIIIFIVIVILIILLDIYFPNK